MQDAGDGCSASCQCEQHPCNFAVDASVHLSSVVSRLDTGATLTLAGARCSGERSCGWNIIAGNTADASFITIRGDSGGGRAVVDCDNAAPVVEQLGNGITGGNLRLVGIHFTNAMRMGGRGGVLNADRASRVVIDDCLVSNSSATGEGGAVYVGGSSTLDIVGSHFEECSADYGGVLAIVDGSEAAISNSKFESCFAFDAGGAILVSRSSTLQLDGSHLSDNHAGNKGGAVALFMQSAVNVSDILVERCTAAWAGACFIIETSRLRLSGRSQSARAFEGV